MSGAAGVELTTAQQAALEAEGDVLVAAAAGSGKTRVLTGRIVRAVVEQGIPISAIVAVTFTEKAAAELRERVARRLAELGRTDAVAALESAPIGTIHSLCARLLRAWPHAAGVSPAFAVLDNAQVAYLRQQALADVFDACDRDPALGSVRVRYGDERLGAYLQQAADIAARRIDGRVAFPDTTDDGRALARMYGMFVDACSRRKRQADGLDFDDLQRLALRLLDDPEVRTRVRCSVQRVLVDEFQDCSQLQVELLERIGAGCMFMVGDEWQSIYRFRGADIEVFRARANRDDGTTRLIGMRHNFRSAPGLVDVVNHAFARAFGHSFEPVVAGRQGQGDGSCELLLVPGSGPGARDAEAATVAARIAGLVEGGTAPGDIAILLARQTHAGRFEHALAAHGIASVRTAARGYWMQQQVRDMVALLQWVRNPLDDRAALSVLASPLIDMQWRDLLRVRRAGGTMFEGLHADRDERSARACNLHDELAAIARNGSLIDVVDYAVHGSGYAEYVLAGADGVRRYANMRKLVELAALAHSLGVGDVGRFLDLVEAQSATAVEGEAALADEAGAAVRIMTVHAAKGLEFQHVFVADAANAGSRSQAKLLADAHGRLAFASVDEHGVAEHVPDELEALRLEDATECELEERRLFYVALTRAEQGLHVSATVPRRRSGELAATGPLAWLAPALDIDVATIGDEPWQHPTLPLVAQLATAPALPVPIAATARAQAAGPHDPHALPELPANELAREARPLPLHGLQPGHDPAQARRGRLVHAALAQLLEAAGTQPSRFGADVAAASARRAWPSGVREVVAGVAASPTFAELVQRGARAEVPFVATVDGTPTAGRFDALAIDSQQGEWWIVDYKLSLPSDPAEAVALHGPQLERYAAAARAGGANSVRLTLVAVDRPHEPVEVDVDHLLPPVGGQLTLA